MKKFFYLSIIALCFTACGPEPPETPIFSVKYYNADEQLVALKNGQTIEISTFDESFLPTKKLLFKGMIYSEESFNLEVTTTREVLEGTSDEFCAGAGLEGKCIPGNGEKAQNFNFDINTDETPFYAHFDAENLSDYKIIYNFHEKEKPSVKISVTVIYKCY